MAKKTKPNATKAAKPKQSEPIAPSAPSEDVIASVEAEIAAAEAHEPEIEFIIPPKDEEEKVPSIEEIMADEDCSRETAAKIHIAIDALQREKAFKSFNKARQNAAHYLCKATRAGGYWRIGRKFAMSETVIFLEELNEAQVAEMEATDPAHLKVSKVGFE